MTDEQIDVLIDRLEKSLRSRTFAGPRTGWLISAMTAPLMFVAEVGPLFGIFSGVIALVAWVTAHDCRVEWRKFQDNRALFLWREWMKREAVNEVGSRFTKKVEMRHHILKIYEKDPRGEVLPLKQAARLVDIYGSQQKRLVEVAGHVDGLRETRSQLLEKSAKLQKLGEKIQSVQAPLQKIEDDLAPLEILAQQIETSCHRLESLLAPVRKALQIKQLRNEIDALTSAGIPEEFSALDEVHAADDLSDIERQITREVETFLHLERETDLHLREV